MVSSNGSPAGSRRSGRSSTSNQVQSGASGRFGSGIGKWRRVDALSVGGPLVAMLAIVGGQALEGGHLDSLINLSAFVIVVGGTIGATMLQVPLPVFKNATRLAVWVISPPASSLQSYLKKVVHWGGLARSKGMLSLEGELLKERNELARKGLRLLIDGTDPQAIREALESDLETQATFDLQSAKVFESMGGYAPTIGILGAVMGLIQVMENLAEPGRLGGGIAAAFVATIYGVGFANLVFLPCANKLKDIVRRQSREQEVVIDGIVAIAEGENPLSIEGRLGCGLV